MALIPTLQLLSELANEDPYEDFYRHRPYYSHYQIPRLQAALASKVPEMRLANVTDDKSTFSVNLDVQQFKPEEINVKLVDDFLIVDGKHEERRDKHGFVSRQFTRRYKLPKDVNMDALASSLSSDGVLTISAPKMVKSSDGARQIPVMKSSEPAIKQAPQASVEEKKVEK